MGACPAQRRGWSRTHDALGYFAASATSIEVIGSVLDSLSTQAQPSAGDAQALVDQMRARDVSVLFAESSVDPRLERAIADEAGARRRRSAVGGHARAPRARPATRTCRSVAANASAIARGFRRPRLRLPAPRDDRAVRPALHAARARSSSRCCRSPAACSARGSPCAGWPSTRTPSARRRSRAWWWRGRGACRRSSRRSARACCWPAGLERLVRGRRVAPDAATGLLLVGALALGVVLASDVYEVARRASTDCCSAACFGVTDADLLLTAGGGAADALGAASACSPLVDGQRVRPGERALARDPRARRRLGAAGLRGHDRGGGGGRRRRAAGRRAAGAPGGDGGPRRRPRRPALLAGSVGLTLVESVAGLWLAHIVDVPPGPAIAVLAADVLFALTRASRGGARA